MATNNYIFHHPKPWAQHGSSLDSQPSKPSKWICRLRVADCQRNPPELKTLRKKNTQLQQTSGAEGQGSGRHIWIYAPSNPTSGSGIWEVSTKPSKKGFKTASEITSWKTSVWINRTHCWVVQTKLPQKGKMLWNFGSFSNQHSTTFGFALWGSGVTQSFEIIGCSTRVIPGCLGSPRNRRRQGVSSNTADIIALQRAIVHRELTVAPYSLNHDVLWQPLRLDRMGQQTSK